MAELITTPLFADANLKAYYRMESTADSKGANTLTNNNSVTFTAGLFANAANFGSSNTNKSLSTTANDLGISGNSDCTFTMWVKLLSEIGSGTWELLVHTSTVGADRYFQLSYDFNGGTRRLRLDPSNGTIVNNTVTLGTSLWHFIAITRNVGGNSATLWVDNINTGSGALGSTTNGTKFITLGANVASDFSSALIDDVGCFNRVLTSAEINSLYVAGGGSFLLNFV